MNYQRFILNLSSGAEALQKNKIRAFLTSLGIIFGVAAVISMLAIGNGAEKEILEQIKQVGSNNIIIKPIIKEPEENKEDNAKKTGRYSPGLSLADVENIKQTLVTAANVSPEIEYETTFLRNGIKDAGKVIGVSNDYFIVTSNSTESGNLFSDAHLSGAESVCIIGKGIKNKFFPNDNPIGNSIKCGKIWLRVVGVLAEKNVKDNASQKLLIRNSNMEVYVPVKAFLLKYRNRALVTSYQIKKNNENNDEDKPKKVTSEDRNYNQLDKVVVHLNSSESIEESTEILRKILLRRHNQVEDFEIVIPELLLKQEQRTKRLFNLVLGIIASISLLVGGIGIMNIMLASVMERTKEIGIRMSLGATRSDIIMQFLGEATMISISGGIAGIIMGLFISFGIEKITSIETIVSPLSVIVSFTISISVGLVFGLMPARTAASQDPIQSLRYE